MLQHISFSTWLEKNAETLPEETTAYCEECRGDAEIPCEDCEGVGDVQCFNCLGDGCKLCHKGRLRCALCNGSGKIDCPECNGKGEVSSYETLYHQACVRDRLNYERLKAVPV